jgi:MraZ protein
MAASAAAGTAASGHGPFSIQCREQDRRQGAGVGAGAFPRGGGEAGLSGTLCAEGARPALDVGGLDLLDRYEARIAMEDPFLQTADDMSYFVHGDSDFLKLDQDGRITVTDFIRDHTGITTEVAFVGRGTFFQMWEPSRLAAYGAQVRERLLALRRAGPIGDAE